MEGRLRDAVAAGDIHAWFQPVVALPGGAVRGYEALVRWVARDGAVMEPASFLEAAGAGRLVVDLDRAVLVDALALLTRLADRRHVSVNLSAASLEAPDLAAYVVSALEAARVAPTRLRLEVGAEPLGRASETSLAAVRALAAHGVAWFVDDVSPGDATSRLRDLPVAGIKLARSCTAALALDPAAAGDAADLLGLARELGLDTVAQGIETRREADVLAAQGWAHGQGWLFGRPSPPDLIR